MIGRLIAFDGRTYQMPPLTEWEIVRTGSVPCDSFCVKCVYSAEMAEILPRVTRFLAMENGEIELFGVVDDYCISCSERGLLLEINGRGLAALLLDSETEAVSYEGATLQEIVRDHALSLGITCAAMENGDARITYKASGGSSHWKVLQECALDHCGVEPHFTKDGKLELKKARGERRKLNDNTPLCAAMYREKRYGVISEITLIDSRSNARSVVKNEEFIARGGFCKRVLYTQNAALAPAAERIEKSCEDSRLLVVTMTNADVFEPGDTVEVSLSKLGLTGLFRVSETTRCAASDGEISEVTMQGV